MGRTGFKFQAITDTQHYLAALESDQQLTANYPANFGLIVAFCVVVSTGRVDHPERLPTIFREGILHGAPGRQRAIIWPTGELVVVVQNDGLLVY
jgi:hypothetical protein